MRDADSDPPMWDLRREIAETYVRKDVYKAEQEPLLARVEKLEGRIKIVLALFVGPITRGVVVWYLTRGMP